MKHPLHHAFKAALTPHIDQNTRISKHTILSWTVVSNHFVNTLRTEQPELFAALKSPLGTRGTPLSDHDKTLLGAVDGATFTHHDKEGKPVSTTTFCLSGVSLVDNGEGGHVLKHDHYMVGKPLTS